MPPDLFRISAHCIHRVEPQIGLYDPGASNCAGAANKGPLSLATGTPGGSLWGQGV